MKLNNFELWQLEQQAKQELEAARQVVTDLLTEQGKWEERIIEARKAILSLAEQYGKAYKRQFDAEVNWMAANARAKISTIEK